MSSFVSQLTSVLSLQQAFQFASSAKETRSEWTLPQGNLAEVFPTGETVSNEPLQHCQGTLPRQWKQIPPPPHVKITEGRQNLQKAVLASSLSDFTSITRVYNGLLGKPPHTLPPWN